MFNSQYYTCEQIDQRLLQGYLDDYNSQNNTNLTKEQFLTLLFNTIGRNNTVDNLVTQIGYYECDTAAGTAAKAITVANYNLFAGGSMKVKFVNKNTANNATFNINSQGAKALYYQGERASSTNSWDEGEVVEIYYDGTNYYANNVKGGSGSGVYDVSVEHPTSGPNEDGKFTLDYIINSSNVNELIPVNKRYPGMSIQFVSTYDNKYVQYRYMKADATTAATFTNVTNWQGVDDESTPNSKNLVESGGVELSKAKNSLYGTPLANLPLFNLAINSSGIFTFGKHSFIPLQAGDTVSITVDTTIIAAFVKSLPIEATAGDSPDYCENTSAIALNTSTPSFEGTAPADVKYLIINRVYSSSTADVDRTSGILSVIVNGFDVVKGLYTNYKSVLDDVTELKTNLAISDAMAKDANGIILGSENLELTSDPTQNTPILSLSNLSIPVGKKIRIRMGGIGTVITSYAYSLNSGSLVTGNTEQIKDIEVETTITNILIVLRSNTFIASGTVTAEVDVYGVSTGIIEDIDKLKGDNNTNKKNIYDDKSKTLGMNIGDFNGTPITYAATPETAEIYSSYIPAGCKVRVVTSGIGTAVSKLSCRINSGTAIDITTDIFEFVTETDVTDFRIYSSQNNIIDNTKTLVISANVIGTKQETESLRSDVTTLQNNEIRVLGKNLFSYNGHPTVLPYYLDSSGWNYPAGKYVIKCTGIGTAITLYNIKINGGSKIVINTDVYEFEIGDGQTLSALIIYTGSNNIIDEQKTVTFSVYYYGLTDRVDDLEYKVNSIGAQKDFDTEYIVEHYATEPTSNEFANSFSFAVDGDSKLNENIIVSSYAMFKNLVDDAVPTVQFTYKDSGNTTIYASPAYTFGKKDDYIQKEWRLPAFPYDCNLIVAVTIPTNVTLYIKEFSNRYSDSINRQTNSYRMNAHTSLYGNFNNIDAFVLSAKVGYPCCIAVPKRTSDGVWVCYHDDGAVGTRLLDENHQQLSAEEQEKTISQFTYARLSQLTYRENNGIYRHVPTLEDFFAICSKTGMHPMFSWHPLVSSSQAEEVKALATKFGLLKYLNIKIGFGSSSSYLSNMSGIYSLFGDDIESYTGDINNDDAIADIITNLDAVNFDMTKVRVGLEFFDARVTLAKVQATLTAGYFAAIAWMNNNPTGEQMEYWIRNGVTEFTEYNNYSNGLNW